MPLHTVGGVGVLRPPWAINSFRSPGTIHAVTPHLGGGVSLAVDTPSPTDPDV